MARISPEVEVDDEEPRRGGRARKAVERFEPSKAEGVCVYIGLII
jgi:hypothetical protein